MTSLPEPQITRYTRWLARERNLHFDATTTEGYDALWRWSVTDLDAFWQSVWDYFDIQSPAPHTAVLARNTMPGAQWFPGAQVNYAREVLRLFDDPTLGHVFGPGSFAELPVAGEIVGADGSLRVIHGQIDRLVVTESADGLRAGGVINFVVITAALSSFNSTTFSGSRMLHSLAMNGQAPRAMARLSASGVPIYVERTMYWNGRRGVQFEIQDAHDPRRIGVVMALLVAAVVAGIGLAVRGNAVLDGTEIAALIIGALTQFTNRVQTRTSGGSAESFPKS